jgi:Fe2+ or Zn2+ uptake regulation protein
MIKQKRNTKTKEIVLSVLRNTPTALSHEEIDEKLKGQLDRVTIYRILQGFCEDGKVHKVSGDNRKSYFALCHHCSEDKHYDEHFHFHCIKCDKVSCINKPAVIPTLPSGYSIENINFIINGYCPNCNSEIT